MSKEVFKEQLKQRIDEVLYYIWDPIQISDAPATRDEYSTYANQVWRNILEGKSKEEVSAFLTNVTITRMDLEARKEHDDKVAELLFEWVKILQNEHEI